MRGKVVLGMLFMSLHRITPAYAGKSYCACLWLDDIEDHPRLCGEKYD